MQKEFIETMTSYFSFNAFYDDGYGMLYKYLSEKDKDKLEEKNYWYSWI